MCGLQHRRIFEVMRGDYAVIVIGFGLSVYYFVKEYAKG